MDGRIVVSFVLLMSIPMVIVDALLPGETYEFNKNSLDRKLKYAQAIEQLKQKDAFSDWDRQMEQELDAKYKELFYVAYNDRNKTYENVRQMVLRHVQEYRPKVTKDVLQEIRSLKKSEIKGPANWQLIMAALKQAKMQEK